MLLTISNTNPPATDLGFLLHKSPYRTQSFELSFGSAHVCYPEVSAERCTAALLLGCRPCRFGAQAARYKRGKALLGAVRERSPVCRLVVHECGHRSGVWQRACGQEQGAR